MKSSVGLGLRHSFYDYVVQHKPTDIPWFEVISENYLNFGGKPISMLKEVNKNYPLVFHGVSLSIGSTDPVKVDYLKKLKNLIQDFNPLWVSDHLCWTYLGAENSHDLLPVPLNRKNLENIISKLLKVQEFLGRKIYLENPSAYVDFNSSEYLEEDFIKEMCTRSGCGLLLDLNNLIVNHYNLGLDPLNYLNTVRNCDVKQIHLAGHSIKENVRIDTHDCEINEEALALLPYAKKLWPQANPMIEWDDKIPPIEELLQKRQNIQNIWNEVPAQELPALNSKPQTFSLKNQTDFSEQNLFFSLIKNKNYVTED